jgi:hypothetical protein
MFSGRHRFHIIVVAGNLYPSVVVAHAGNHVGNHGARVGRPVAIVTAVQCARWPVDGELETSHTALSEGELLPSALVHRSIAEEPGIAGKRAGVRLEDLAQVPRSRLLLAMMDPLSSPAERP